MENEITKTQTSLNIWENPEKVKIIKDMFAKDLTENEFKVYLEFGKALQANPFTREIYAQVYSKNDPTKRQMTIFCGRDFYRRKAQEQADYDGHIVEAVYENDVFKNVNGQVHHELSMKNRGKLLGAYCVAYRKNVRIPGYIYVLLSEYKLDQSIWKTKEETMIKKVAESQGLRGTWQGVFQGTYAEDEQWAEKEINPKTNPTPNPTPLPQNIVEPVKKEIPANTTHSETEQEYLERTAREYQEQGSAPNTELPEIGTEASKEAVKMFFACIKAKTSEFNDRYPGLEICQSSTGKYVWQTLGTYAAAKKAS